MKKVKKFLSLILSFLIVIGSISISFSVTATAVSDDNTIVVRMYICHRSHTKELSGHTFLYFENKTNGNITIGVYTLAKGKGVSVGTMGSTVDDGRGLYYNIEAYRYNKYNITNTIYFYKDLTQKQLDSINKKITVSGYWNRLLNCAWFATTTWDVVFGKFLVYLIFPPLTKLEFMAFPHESCLKMYYPTANDVYKQVGFGRNATLIHTNA